LEAGSRARKTPLHSGTRPGVARQTHGGQAWAGRCEGAGPCFSPHYSSPFDRLNSNSASPFHTGETWLFVLNHTATLLSRRKGAACLFSFVKPQLAVPKSLTARLSLLLPSSSQREVPDTFARRGRTPRGDQTGLARHSGCRQTQRCPVGGFTAIFRGDIVRAGRNVQSSTVSAFTTARVAGKAIRHEVRCLQPE